MVQDVKQFIAWVLECDICTFGWKWGNALSWFSIMFCILCTYFHKFTLLSSVKCQNVFCSGWHLNCSLNLLQIKFREIWCSWTPCSPVLMCRAVNCES
jgi:hypothetical protein